MELFMIDLDQTGEYLDMDKPKSYINLHDLILIL